MFVVRDRCLTPQLHRVKPTTTHHITRYLLPISRKRKFRLHANILLLLCKPSQSISLPSPGSLTLPTKSNSLAACLYPHPRKPCKTCKPSSLNHACTTSLSPSSYITDPLRRAPQTTWLVPTPSVVQHPASGEAGKRLTTLGMHGRSGVIAARVRAAPRRQRLSSPEKVCTRDAS